MGAMMEETLMKGADLRIGKYDIHDDLNDITNSIIAYMNQGGDRDNILAKIKRVKDKVNNL